MNQYFLTLVLKADQTESSRKELLDSVEKKLKMENGELKTDLWGARDLAYPIKKQTKGYYAHFEFEGDPSIAKDLDKTLRVEEDIIRYLLVRANTSRSKFKTRAANAEQKSKVEEK